MRGGLSRGAEVKTHQRNLLLLLPDLAQVCARRLTGEGVLEETPDPAVCQLTGRSWQREDSKEAKQVYLSFAELTPDELDHLGAQLNSLNKVNGVQRFEPCQTPEEEMAGELQHEPAEDKALLATLGDYYRCSRGPVQEPKAACRLQTAPQPVLEASELTALCLDTWSKSTAARRNAGCKQG
ncbi:hypothetical protein M9458_056614 [Cirrhinus mrigala]|uniref:Uncharacterized protein n=1 Tax=Cirrhinus mrigala TaxID=683832 RepID=A0ABD0MGP2_CIRMR